MLRKCQQNEYCTIIVPQMQEFQDLWEHLAIVFDGGTLGDTEECRKGSTVVNLAAPGTYKVIRDGRFVSYKIRRDHEGLQ